MYVPRGTVKTASVWGRIWHVQSSLLESKLLSVWTQVTARLSLNSVTPFRECGFNKVTPFREYGFNNLRQACTLLTAQSSLSVCGRLKPCRVTKAIGVNKTSHFEFFDVVVL